MVKIDAFLSILSCIHWFCLGLTKARKHLLHCTERRELAIQGLTRANPPAPTSYTTTASYGSKPSAQSTIHSLAEVRPLGGGHRQEAPGSCQRPTTLLQSKTGFQLASKESWLYLPSVEQFSDFTVEIFAPHFGLIALFTQLYFYNEIINFWGKSQAFQSLLHKTQK